MGTGDGFSCPGPTIGRPKQPFLALLREERSVMKPNKAFYRLEGRWGISALGCVPTERTRRQPEKLFQRKRRRSSTALMAV